VSSHPYKLRHCPIQLATDLESFVSSVLKTGLGYLAIREQSNVKFQADSSK
jgi:hypothetical protein